MKSAEEILPNGQNRFSPKEAASYIGFDPSTVSRWCESGKIEASKPMGRWQITRNAMVKLLIAFGVAAAALFHGNHTHYPYTVDTAKIYHTEMKEQAIKAGQTFNQS